jgi:hypothetical protein
MYTLVRIPVRPLGMHRRYTTRPDATAAASAEQSTLSPPSLDNFFSKSALVVNKRKFNRERGQLHFIFLEGLPGTGKQGVLWRLNKVCIEHILKILPHRFRGLIAMDLSDGVQDPRSELS